MRSGTETGGDIRLEGFLLLSDDVDRAVAYITTPSDWEETFESFERDGDNLVASAESGRRFVIAGPEGDDVEDFLGRGTQGVIVFDPDGRPTEEYAISASPTRTAGPM